MICGVQAPILSKGLPENRKISLLAALMQVMPLQMLSIRYPYGIVFEFCREGSLAFDVFWLGPQACVSLLSQSNSQRSPKKSRNPHC